MAVYRSRAMSALRDALARYIAVRRAFGTQLREPAVTLGQFVEHVEREHTRVEPACLKGSPFITTKLALGWACQSDGVQRATWARRLSMVRKFAAWQSAFDPRTEVPPRRLLNVRHRRSTPHIFTNQEIEQLMTAAGRLPMPRGRSRAETYVTLIGLLASTGLRPGEALALDVRDVDLQNGILAIRQTKFGKSRIVPVDDSTRVALSRYAKRRNEFHPKCGTDAFFVSVRGTRLDPGSARRTFAMVSRAIGLRAPMEGKRVGHGPTLYDFRHTFATRRLIEWYRAGLDVNRELPKLSTYLGHVDVANTYWYIEAVPELLQLATEYLTGRQGRSCAALVTPVRRGRGAFSVRHRRLAGRGAR